MVLPQETRTALINQMTFYLPTLRKVLRITQTQLGKIIGLDRSTIALIETGVHKMSWAIYLSLLMLFLNRPTTVRLLIPMKIYTPELDFYLREGCSKKKFPNN